MPTITAPTQGIEWGGSASLSTALVEAEGTEVWVTDVGGARLFQVPTDAITGLSWTEPLDGPVTADLSVSRYYLLDPEDPDSWLANWLRPLRPEATPYELQIVHDGKVPCWGPILTNTRTPGDAELKVKAADFDWWFTARLLQGVDPDWGREWLRNHDFSNGLDGWFVEQPNPVVADEILHTNGGRVSQEVHFPFSADQTATGSWRVKWTVRVWIDSVVPDEFVWATMLASGRVGGPQVSRQFKAGDLNRDQWQTVVTEFDLTNTASQTGRKATFTFEGDFPGYDSDDIQIDETSVQVAPESLGHDMSDVRRRVLMTQQKALFEVVHSSSEGLNVAPSADGAGRTIEAPWRNRGDVYASEALRQIEDTEAEIEPVRTVSARLLVLRTALRGVEHDPGDLTLTHGDNVSVIGSWETGVTKPTNEWRMLSDSGFAGVYQDMSRYGGLLLQNLTAAPTGTADSELPHKARELSTRAADESDAWRIEVPASVAVATGDRALLVIDDGPDQWSDLVRVTSRTVDPSAPTVVLDVRRWDGG